jgi:uncharacterized protein YndB with AHSA1/START domain
MIMEHIRHRVGITASPARIYEALATKEGLAGWWPQHVEGEETHGGTLRFFFGDTDPRVVMEVVDLAPTQRVGWRCVQGPEEWVGTALTFELTTGDEETEVLFTHANWREPVEFLHHCSTKWAYFLLGLKTWMEGGASVATPNDMKISSWG